MKRFGTVFALVAATLIVGVSAHRAGAEGTPETAAKPSSAIYWCGSASDGVCSGISTTLGTCPDGKPMNAGHVIGMEGTTALVCICGADCTCKIDPKDPTKCGCNKPIRHIDLAGTGIYHCSCGAACDCNTISDKPGTCKCGKPLVQVK